MKGVKGVTVIDLLPTFETVRGVTADYMHSVCLGVTRKMVDLWVDSKHHNEEYYIGRKVDIINKRLQAISPPSEMHRAPRPLSERCHWKASEWRPVLFYSLVVLKGILPARYLNHFFLYVYGVYIPLGDSITQASIACAEAALNKFVIQVEQLYGLQHCSFNVHCLTHLPHCVKDCGPLWSTLAAFIFESHNHCLLKMFNGTQCVPEQITDTFMLKRTTNSMARSCIDGNTCISIVNLLKKLNDTAKFAHDDTCATVSKGKATRINITASQTIAIQNLLNLDVVNRSGLLYQRFVHDHQIYSSVHYTRAKRHSNCTIMFKGETESLEYGTVLGLLEVKPHCECNGNSIQYCNCQQYLVVLVKPMGVNNIDLYKDADFNLSSSFLLDVFDREVVLALFPNQILCKCILMCLGNKKFVCPLPFRIYGD